MCLVLGRIRTFPQKNGPQIQLRVFGDEFYARYETLDGFTVLYDTDQETYCYAILAGGSLVSSGAPLHKPVPFGVPKGLQEDKTVRNQKFDSAFGIMRPSTSPPPGVSATFGANKGLLPGTQLSRQTKVRGLTILVNFKDVKSEVQSQEVAALLNQDNFNSYGNACSVKTYFQTISSGRLTYVNEVVGPVTLQKNRTHYIGQPCMQEALDLAVETLGVRLAAFDSLNRGVVDAVNFLYAGETLYSGWLWPHNHILNYTCQGMAIDLYTIQSIGRSAVDMKIGTFCHEAGHLICRFPDLYDYGKRDGDSDPSAGMGDFCLMASGSHLNRGRSPAPVCGYLRHLAGWAKNEVLVDTPGRYQARHGDYDTVFKHPVASRPNEYFIIENRSRMGLDTHCPASGLAVYHCDTQGSNEWQGGTADKHYQCALVQADGARHLENNRNQGDASDLFQAGSGLILSRDTIPSSRAWGGTASGLDLFNVTQPGEEIFFETGRPSGPGSDTDRIFKESRPSALIPDHDPRGIRDSILVLVSGSIQEVSLDLDITHPFIGDLKVVLEPPGQKAVTLWDRQGGGTDDLKAAFHIQDKLSSLKGQDCKGEWTLWVMDLAGQDQGRLNRWHLDIRHKKEARVILKEKTTPLPIPDKDGKGVTSVIPVQEKGRIKEATLNFEINHSYHGDLVVTLTPPHSGPLILVPFNSLGSRKGTLAREISTQADLAPLVSTEASGDWSLNVCDQWEKDVGTLVRWSLALVVEAD